MNCPYCQFTVDRDHALLGSLGATSHYRCPCCGGQWSRTPRKRTARVNSSRKASR